MITLREAIDAAVQQYHKKYKIGLLTHWTSMIDGQACLVFNYRFERQLTPIDVVSAHANLSELMAGALYPEDFEVLRWPAIKTRFGIQGHIVFELPLPKAALADLKFMDHIQVHERFVVDLSGVFGNLA